MGRSGSDIKALMHSIFLRIFFAATALLLYPACIIAQYKGGVNDGYSFATNLNQNALPGIYTGGNNDGFSVATVINQNALPGIYTGGINDGISISTVIDQNAIPGIYAGGVNDGVDHSTSLAQNALPGIYAGGINDGVDHSTSLAQNALPGIYAGGINDGVSTIIVTTQNPFVNIYTGGANDGWATFSVTKQNQLVILPVHLLEFNGVWQGDDILVSWKTASETDNDHFDVERSIDNGASFRKIGMVNGHGTSNTVNDYSFLDTDVKNQNGTVFYYRLKPVAIDGHFTYSAIVKLSRKEKQVTYTLFPNPSDGHFTVQVKGVNTINGYSYQVFSEQGAPLQSGSLQSVTTSFDLSKLPSAAYWIRIIKDGRPETTIKIILIK